MARIFRSFPVYRPLSQPIVSPAITGPPVGKQFIHMTQPRRWHVGGHWFSKPLPAAVVVTERRQVFVI